METISFIIPEVKIEMPIKGLTFDKLEQLTFDVTRPMICRAIEDFLQCMDEVLRKSRPRGALKNLGRISKHILTRFGEVRHSRTRYEDQSTGEMRYLIDEALGLVKDQRISLSRQKLEIHAVSEGTYRQSRDNIKRLTGSSRSHEAMRQSVIKEAEKIIEHQKKKMEKVKMLESDDAGEIPEVAYTEADATQIRLQRSKKGEVSRRKKKKRHLEVKLGVGYMGKEKRYKSGDGAGKRLVKKFVHVSLESRRKFMEEFSMVSEMKLNLSRAKKVFFGGDGDTWIKTGIGDFFPGAVYLLCRFHLQRGITTALGGIRTTCALVKKLICEDRIEEALEEIEKASCEVKEDKEREKIEELYGYVSNNRDGISAAAQLDETQEKTGVIEPNIDKVIAQRFKKRGMSWSRKGAISLLKVRETIINGDWDTWWQDDRDKKIFIKGTWKAPLPATSFKKSGKQGPWIEAKIPAFEGIDQDKPWAGVLRAITEIRYRAF
jgi:hypothetical protein